MTRKIPMPQSLSCFEAAPHHESCTIAARELSLTYGAVSRQVATLEGFFGVCLFRRSRHGVALSPAGEACAHQVAVRLAGLERDMLDAMTLTRQRRPTFATRWLLPRLAGLGVALLAKILIEVKLHQQEPQIMCEKPLGSQRAYYLVTPEATRDTQLMAHFRGWMQAHAAAGQHDAPAE